MWSTTFRNLSKTIFTDVGFDATCLINTRLTMGRNRSRRAKHGQHSQSRQPSRDERKPYKLLPKSNKDFESYYQMQHIVPEGEWDSFIDALRKPLPATFRITGFNNLQSQELLKLIKGEYFDKLVNVEVEGRVIDPPKCLPWYPNELAWQLDMDRKFIRQCETLKKLHNFLVEETESGNISRQEAVSMIPPLIMDVQPHHKVLDMCAAPGSKTAQIIEMLHACNSPVPVAESFHLSEGCVIGNDSDNKRCYLMTHQVKRLESASFIIINQDASCMPNFKLPDEDGQLKSLKFDRILADVPCSGDGTLRKNVDAWAKWNAHTAMHLHNLQSRILSRGLEMLVVGGRLVYSTCSLNPVENEAVISNLLRKSKGTVKLVDVDAKLPGLKGMPGMSSWKIISREMEEYTDPEQLPASLKNTIRPSVFPPTDKEVQMFDLQKCLRILPHHQDTGGFFIALLEKLEEVPWVTQPKKTNASNGEVDPSTNTNQISNTQEQSTQDGMSTEVTDSEKATNDNVEMAENTADLIPVSSNKRKIESRSNSPPPKRQKRFGYKEDPFIFISEDDPIWPPIRDFFKLKNFPANQLLVRCTEGKKRNLYFASPIVKSLLTHNIGRFKFINLGLKILSRSDSPNVPCPFRTVQEGVGVLYPHVTDRVVSLTMNDIVTLLSSEMPYLECFSEGLRESLQGFGQGSIIFVYDPEKDASLQCRMVLCGWLGRSSCRSFIPLNERGHYLRLCGAELVTRGQRKKAKLANDSASVKTTSDLDADSNSTDMLDPDNEPVVKSEEGLDALRMQIFHVKKILNSPKLGIL
ncbi:hypothetical protein LSH36_35g04062 [Paralvinella palmiformis]|uniref:tRNA (cytosine(34)-C(5))-methyltransferase n=1 Tax=Paralvinella palmiformis TaxID=53620 RepID=A0AAD9K8S3_9ANNE|nr:hypothetical protein LSH36_35g04062 [Paralvinella palmiformis]